MGRTKCVANPEPNFPFGWEEGGGGGKARRGRQEEGSREGKEEL